MPRSIETPVSSIADPAHGKSPREALTGFLKYTVDSPDLERARAFVSKRSAAAGRLHAVPPGAAYTLGPEETDELGTRIAVTVRAGGWPDASQEITSPQEEFTVPVVVVEEEGEWKIDLPATMERMLGVAASAAGEAIATGQALAAALTGAQAALSDSLASAAPSTPPRPAAASKKKTAPPAKKTAKKPPAKKPVTKKSAAKSKPKPKPKPKKKSAAQKTVRHSRPAAKPKPATKKRRR